MLSFCCCSGFSAVAESWGYSLGAVHRLLIVVASPVGEEHGLQGTQTLGVAAHGLNPVVTVSGL